VGGGVQTGTTRHVGHLLAYCTCPGWLWGWRIWWNEWQKKPKYSEKTCLSAILSTTNPTWPDPGLNLGRRGGKPATNRFSYGTALLFVLIGMLKNLLPWSLKLQLLLENNMIHLKQNTQAWSLYIRLFFVCFFLPHFGFCTRNYNAVHYQWQHWLIRRALITR
jgi:hypothetical protein